MPKLIHLEEPKLEFGYRQQLEDPRDGLALFGPLDEQKPDGIRVGAIGTKPAINRLKSWLETVQGPVFDESDSIARPIFPGFEAVFGIPLHAKPYIELEISQQELEQALYIDDKHQRVYQTVTLFEERIAKSLREDDAKVDIWFLAESDDVYKYSRPQSTVEPSKAIAVSGAMSVAKAKDLLKQPPLFEEFYEDATPYYYEVDFHNQLKARLLKHGAVAQVVRESTIAFREILNQFDRPTRNLQDSQAAIAWNILSTAFYKAGGKPWKLANVRKGVCYVGITFKIDHTGDGKKACCAAQMFLDSGDGVVFKGAVGPWYNPDTLEYHLSEEAAQDLVRMTVNAYTDRMGEAPTELFIHGRVRFSDEEWRGFKAGASKDTNLVGVRIRQANDLKLYRQADFPVMRGLAYVRNDRSAYLWTNGYIPRLETYPGREVPWPIYVDVSRGNANINTVLRDVLGLTKLNYNACIYGDGLPITLKFADAIGEILTAAPLETIPPLTFRNYI
jgi:hypothetical protein